MQLLYLSFKLSCDFDLWNVSQRERVGGGVVGCSVQKRVYVCLCGNGKIDCNDPNCVCEKDKNGFPLCQQFLPNGVDEDNRTQCMIDSHSVI